MNNRIVVGIIVLLAGVGIGWYVLRQVPPKDAGTGVPEPTLIQGPGSSLMGEDLSTPPSALGEGEKGGVAARVVVTFTDSGFSPKTVTVAAGSTVAFMNESGGSMWVASAIHPTHQLLPGFDQLKSVAKGGSYEYTFAKVGTWTYHNHVAPTQTGTVVVTK